MEFNPNEFKAPKGAIDRLGEFPFNKTIAGTNPCGEPKCELCVLTMKTHVIKLPNGLEFVTEGIFCCKSCCIVYVGKCEKCRIFYVGQTSQSLCDRMGLHENDPTSNFGEHTRQHRSAVRVAVVKGALDNRKERKQIEADFKELSKALNQGLNLI